MKKFFQKIFLFIALGGMSFTMTSCDEESISQIVQILIETLAGQTINYDCKGYVQKLYKKDGATGYSTDNDKVTFQGVISVKYGQNQATMTVPNFAIEDIEMSTITISGLALVSDGSSKVKIQVPDAGVSADGNIIVSGVQYPISNIYVDGSKEEFEGTATQNTLSFTTLDLYFGDNEQYVVQLTNINGTAQAQ